MNINCESIESLMYNTLEYWVLDELNGTVR